MREPRDDRQEAIRRVWARISRHSLKDLGLGTGQRAWCLVKAVSFDTDISKP